MGIFSNEAPAGPVSKRSRRAEPEAAVEAIDALCAGVVARRGLGTALQLYVEVADTGRGIADDDLPRIFDPFFSTKQGEAQSGMGLGLPVSRSLIEAMGGRIDVETTPVRGACFTAVFPRQVDAPQEASHD